MKNNTMVYTVQISVYQHTDGHSIRVKYMLLKETVHLPNMLFYLR